MLTGEVDGHPPSNFHRDAFGSSESEQLPEADDWH
jgi:hypothetical protein